MEEERYQEHVKKKMEAQAAKAPDKELAQNGSNGEKICLRGFQQSEIKTSLLGYRD